MPSIEEMKALYAKKQQKSKERKTLITEGEPPPMVKKAKKTIRVSSKTIKEPKKKVNRSEEFVEDLQKMLLKDYQWLNFANSSTQKKFKC